MKYNMINIITVVRFLDISGNRCVTGIPGIRRAQPDV